MKKPIETSQQDVVDYWSMHEDECGLALDWVEAHDCSKLFKL